MLPEQTFDIAGEEDEDGRKAAGTSRLIGVKLAEIGLGSAFPEGVRTSTLKISEPEYCFKTPLGILGRFWCEYGSLLSRAER